MGAAKIRTMCWTHAKGYNFNDWQAFVIPMSCRPMIGDYVRVEKNGMPANMRIARVIHDVFDLSKEPFLRIWLEEEDK